jgi:hypothetical protein
MARDGYRIFDSDTHVGPDARILAGYLSEAEKDRLSGWEAYKSRDRSGHETYTKGQRRYRRRLGTAEPDETNSLMPVAQFNQFEKLDKPIMQAGGEADAYKLWHQLSDERNRYLDGVDAELIGLREVDGSR